MLDHPIITVLLFLLLLPSASTFNPKWPTRRSNFASQATSTTSIRSEPSHDAIVVGSGIGGLASSLLLTSLYNRSVHLLESHPTSLGGCAHTFTLTNKRGLKFTFDAGPSLLTGLSAPSFNPLRQAFDVCGLQMPEMIEYDGWIIHSRGTRGEMGVGDEVDVGEGSEDYKFWLSYKMSTSTFPSVVRETFGEHASSFFKSFTSSILSPKGLYQSSNAIPPFALRGDKWAAASLKGYYRKLLGIGPKTGSRLTGPFRAVYDQFVEENPPPSPTSERFLRNHFDYLSFALSGYDMSRTQAAPVAYMTGDLHLPGANVNFPKQGGALGPIVDSMAEKISSQPSSAISKGTTVTSLILEGPDNRCVGVNAIDVKGNVVSYRSKEGVILNVPVWSIPKILETTADELPEGPQKEKLEETIKNTLDLSKKSKKSGSFMHAYLAVPSSPSDFPLECHHSVIMDWGEPIDAKQNMVIISIPTVFDSSLASEGFHIIHAYTAASDDFNEFKGFLQDGERPESDTSDGSFSQPNPYKNDDYNKNPDYIALKEKQSEVLFDAISRVIPDIRDRLTHEDAVVEIGTPLTHRRFNRRAYGTYGPGVDEDGSVWNLLQAKSLNIPNLYLAGDSTFPGIGIPGVAASGTIAANSFVGIREHNRELSRSRKEKILQ